MIHLMIFSFLVLLFMQPMNADEECYDDRTLDYTLGVSALSRSSQPNPGRYVFMNSKICKTFGYQTRGWLYVCERSSVFFKDPLTSNWMLRTKLFNATLSTYVDGESYIYQTDLTVQPLVPSICSSSGVLYPFCGTNYTFTVVNNGIYERNFGSFETHQGTWADVCALYDGVVFDCASLKLMRWELPKSHSLPNKRRFYINWPQYPSNNNRYCPDAGEVESLQPTNISGGDYFAFYFGQYSGQQLPETKCACDTSGGDWCFQDLINKPQIFVDVNQRTVFPAPTGPYTVASLSGSVTVSVHYAGEARYLVDFYGYYSPVYLFGDATQDQVISLGKMTPKGTTKMPVYIDVIAFIPTSDSMFEELKIILRASISYTGSLHWTVYNLTKIDSLRTYRFFLQLFCDDYCTVQYLDSVDNELQQVNMYPIDQILFRYVYSDTCVWLNSYIYLAGVAYHVRPGFGTLTLNCHMIYETNTWVKLFCLGPNFHAYLEVCPRSLATLTLAGGNSYYDTVGYQVTDARFKVNVAPVDNLGSFMQTEIVSFEGKSLVDSGYILYSYSDRTDFLYAATAGQQIIVKASSTNSTFKNITTRTISVYTFDDLKTDSYAVTETKTDCIGFEKSIRCIVDRYPEIYALPAIALFAAFILLCFLLGRVILDCRKRRYIKSTAKTLSDGAGYVADSVVKPGVSLYNYVTKSKSM